MAYRGVETYEVARARGPRHETWEPVGRNATIVFAPMILDERTWNVIGMEAAEGHFERPIIYLPDTDEWFFERDFPIPLALGIEVEGMVEGYNDSPSTATLKGTLELIDPDGIARGTKSYTASLAAGEAMYLGTEWVTLDKEGVWRLHAKLEA